MIILVNINKYNFGNMVSKLIKNLSKKYNKIYISTNGLGVPYFHLMLDLEQKYYKTKKFI